MEVVVVILCAMWSRGSFWKKLPEATGMSQTEQCRRLSLRLIPGPCFPSSPPHPPHHVPLPPLTRRDLCGHGRDRMASHGKVSLVASESDRQRGCWEGVGQKTFILKDSIS